MSTKQEYQRGVVKHKRYAKRGECSKAIKHSSPSQEDKQNWQKEWQLKKTRAKSAKKSNNSTISRRRPKKDRMEDNAPMKHVYVALAHPLQAHFPSSQGQSLAFP